MTDYALDSLSNFLREETPKVFYESLANVAHIFNYIKTTYQGVTRDGIGKDWKVDHMFRTGLAGLIQYANPSGPEMVAASSIGSQVQVIAHGSAASGSPFPTAVEAPHTNLIKRQLQLHMVTGNFSIPITWMQGDALAAADFEKVALDIKSVGELRALVEASSLFAYRVAAASTYTLTVLGRITGTPAEISTTNKVKFTVDEAYGRIQNFHVGETIDIVADSSGTPQDGTALDGTDIRNCDGTYYVRLYVIDVDTINKTVTVIGVNSNSGAVAAYGGTHGWTTAGSAPPASGDWCVLAKCSQNVLGRPMFSWGFEDWMAASGAIMGGTSGTSVLDLDTYSQFKSKVKDVSAPLTDDVLNAYVGAYLDSYPGQSLDTIMTTFGVTLKFLQSSGLYGNQQVWDRTGQPVKMVGGWDEVGFSFNGRRLRWIINPLMLSKRLYAIKLNGGNVTRYVPPPVGGQDARIGGECQFLAPLGGHTGIFMPARTSTGAALDILEAPFWSYNLIAPLDPRGVKLYNLTEATMT